MDKIDKEKIERQLDKIQKVSPDENFLLRMETLAIRALRPATKISRIQILLVAASLALLLIANVFLVQQSGEISALSDAYNLIPTKSAYNG